MSLALYRKYRSKSLDEIVGQGHVTSILRAAISAGKVGHAYLLTGPRGVGKTSIARIMAHEINGLEYQEVERDHLDIIEIDAASNNSVEDVRAMREKLNISPALAKYRVIIIDEVHMLSGAAFNALLKTLEEPPEHIIFIMATTDAHKLPATILSRVQQLHFKLISAQEVGDQLKKICDAEGIGYQNDAIALLAKYGGGSMRDSVSLLDTAASGGVEITAELVEDMLGIASDKPLDKLVKIVSGGGGAREISAQVAEMLEMGISPGRLAVQMYHKLRDIEGISSDDLLGLAAVESGGRANLDIKLELALMKIAESRRGDAHVVVEGKREQRTENGERQEGKEEELSIPLPEVTAPPRGEKPERASHDEIPDPPRRDPPSTKVLPEQGTKYKMPNINIGAVQNQLYMDLTRAKLVVLAAIIGKAGLEIKDGRAVITVGNLPHANKLNQNENKAMLSELLQKQGIAVDEVSAVKGEVSKVGLSKPDAGVKSTTEPEDARTDDALKDIMELVGGEVVEF